MTAAISIRTTEQRLAFGSLAGTFRAGRAHVARAEPLENSTPVVILVFDGAAGGELPTDVTRGREDTQRDSRHCPGSVKSHPKNREKCVLRPNSGEE